MKINCGWGRREKQRSSRDDQSGSALVVVVLVVAFMFSVGLVLLQVTSAGPKVAVNIRSYQQAFNAAEAGFDQAWLAISERLDTGEWTSFDGHYLTEPAGIDDPNDDNSYFRRLSDGEILALIGEGTNGVLFYRQTFVPAQGGEWTTGSGIRFS